MAQLTWREVQAPNLSTRDMALASNQIGQSFDRLGELLIRREDNLRKDATDTAATGVLLARNEKEAQAAAAAAMADPNKRINRREIAELLNPTIAALQQREEAGDRLLGIRAHNLYGQYMPELQAAQFAANGERLAALRAQVGDSPEALRWLADSSDEGWAAWNAGDTSRHKAADRTTTERGQDLSHAGVMAQVGVARQRLALERQEAEERRRKEADKDRLTTDSERIARNFVSKIKPGEYATAEDAKVVLARAMQGRKIPTELSDAILNGVTGQFNARFGLTGDEQSDLGALPGTAGRTDAMVAQAAIRDRAFRANPGLAIQQRVSEMGEDYIKELTLPGVAAKLKKAGLGGQADAYVEQALGSGASLAELDAMADVSPIRGPGFWRTSLEHITKRGAAGALVGGSTTAWTGPGAGLGAAVGGGVGGLYGLGEGTYDWYTGSQRRAASIMDNLRDRPVIEQQRVDMQGKLQRFDEPTRRLARLEAFAKQEKATYGQVSEETKEELRIAERQLKEAARASYTQGQKK